MTKVFLGGSRAISRFNRQVEERLDHIIESGFPVLIGDANGADKAFQRYLLNRRYQNVQVFCSDGVCRNNLGDWELRPIAARPEDRGARFYAAKDRAMAREATAGFMLWDGKSVGTLLNVLRLVRLGKPVIVYIASAKRFQNLKRRSDFDGLLENSEPALGRTIRERAASEEDTVDDQPMLI